jgi:hypothetical protein
MDVARRLAVPLAVLAALLPAAPADARNCRSVGSWRVVASNVSCAFARDAARTYARHRTTPRGWRCVRRARSLSCARGNRALGAYRR